MPPPLLSVRRTVTSKSPPFGFNVDSAEEISMIGCSSTISSSGSITGFSGSSVPGFGPVL